MTFLPAISQTGAQTAVDIFGSFSNKKQCFMIASLNILRCAAMKCNVLRLRHCTVKSKKLVWTWLRKGLLSELITTLWWGDIPLGSIKLIWWLYFDVIRSPYLEHDVNTHTPLRGTLPGYFCFVKSQNSKKSLISIRDVENASSTSESPGCNWNGG